MTAWLKKVSWIRLIGLLLLGVLFWQLDIPVLIQVFKRTDKGLLVMAIMLNLPAVLCKSLRWQGLMYSQQIHYPVKKAFLAYFGSIFIGFLTPGRLGEFVKAIHVNQDCQVPLEQAFSSVLADRLFDLYLLLFVGGMALLSISPDNVALAGLIGLLLFLTLPLILFLHKTTFSYLQHTAVKFGTVGQKMLGSGGWLTEMRGGLKQVTWGWMGIAVCLTLLAYIIFFSQGYLLALALNLQAGFVLISFAVALGSLVTLLPISISGLGTRETAIVVYLGTAAIPAEEAVVFSLCVFFTFYIGSGLIGAIAWLIKPVPLPANFIRKAEK